MFSNFFFSEMVRLWYDVEKYGRVRQATDDSIIWRVRFACWVTKATDTKSMQHLLLLQRKICYANAPQFYIVLSLPDFFMIKYLSEATNQK